MEPQTDRFHPPGVSTISSLANTWPKEQQTATPTAASHQEDSRRLFHYTHLGKLPLIIADGQINTATAFIKPGERPAVWFTFRPDWEPTAATMLRAWNSRPQPGRSGAKLMSGDTRMRIEIEQSAAPHDWQDFIELAGCPPRTVRGLAETARKLGSSPEDWRVSFTPILHPSWKAIELFQNGKWSRLTNSDDLGIACLREQMAA